MRFNSFAIQGIVNSPNNYAVAKRYHQFDALRHMSIFYVDHSDYYSLKAVVNNGTSNQTCFIVLSSDWKVEETQCSCPYHTHTSACGHIGAVLLKLAELDVTSFPFIYDNDDEQRRQQRFLDLQKQRTALETQRHLSETQTFMKQLGEGRKFSLANRPSQVSLLPHLEYDSSNQEVLLSYHIGSAEKSYVLKDLNAFLLNLENHDEINYGKHLNFKLDLMAFDAFSRNQIEFIRRLLFTRQNQFYYTSSDKRSLSIDSHTIEAFFELYKDHPYSGFVLDDENHKLRLILEDHEQYYRLLLAEFNIAGDTQIYSIYESPGRIHLDHLISEPTGLVLSLFNQLKKENGMIYIDKKDWPLFHRRFLDAYSDYLEIEGYEFMPELKTQVKLYGDIDDDGSLKFWLDIVQGEQVVNHGFITQNPDLAQQFVESALFDTCDHFDSETKTAYFDINKEKTKHFIDDGLSQLRAYCQIYVSEALVHYNESRAYQVHVGVSMKNDLLHIDFDSVDIPLGELANVLSAYRQKKKFLRLKNGQILSTNSDSLRELDAFVSEQGINLKDIKDGGVDLNRFRSFSLDNFADSAQDIEIERSQSFTAALESFVSYADHPAPLLEHYQTLLRDYQKAGYQWFRTICDNHFGGILADDMGLGKTLQTIALIDHLKAEQGKRCSIVVCPSSVIYNWRDEILRFSDDLSVGCVIGDQQQRAEIISAYQDYDILVTSYDYLRRDTKLYETCTFACIILDEAQYIKNHGTKNAQVTKHLKGEHRFALTGTPIENTLAELWSIFDFLMPGYLYSYNWFLEHFEKPIVNDKDEEVQLKLKRLIEPFILRRMKKDVIKELPDKIENDVLIPFKPEERKLYFAHLAQVNEALNTQVNQSGEVNRVVILAMLTKLRQLCCEPRLLFENIKEPSSKLESCLNLIDTLIENNQKVLLFSSFTSVLDLIGVELDKKHLSYFRISGAVNKEERRDLVQRFHEDDTMIFLISLKAGGTGLNLTAASAIIHYDPWWNLSAQNQATDRAYRIGQHKNVQVFKLIMKDSIEEKIVQLQNQKKELVDQFVENNEGTITSMNLDDIKTLLKE